MKPKNPQGATLVTIILMVAMGWFFQISFKNTKTETDVIITSNDIQFAGKYGKAYLIEDLLKVQLKEEMPPIITKKNGAWISNPLFCKGRFKLENIGDAMLYIHTAQSPFVYLYTRDDIVIFNFEDPEKTKLQYDAIFQVIQQNQRE